jgi:ribonuclease D
LPLRSQLEEQLDKLNRREWLAEELAELGDMATIVTEPEQAWRRIKGLRGLDPGRVRLARALAAWRERRASERNRPRGWILEDGAVRDIVVQVPRSADALASISGMPPNLVKHCGEEILECVRAAEIPDPAPVVETRQRPDPAKAALLRTLAALNQSIAGELGLSPEVLATRRDLEQLADGRRDVSMLRGWRRSVVGERMLAAL